MRKLLVIAVALLIGVSPAAMAAQKVFAPVQGGPVATGQPAPEWAPDHVLVQFTEKGMERADLPAPGEKASGPAARTGIATLDQAMDELDVQGLKAAFPRVADKKAAAAVGADRWFILDLDPGIDIPTAIGRLAADPNLASVQPDRIAYPSVTPNDPMHPDHWGHDNTAQLPEFDWGGTWDHTGPGVGTVGFDANAHAAWGGTQGYGSSGVVIAIVDTGVDPGHPDLVQMTGYDFGDNDNNPEDDSAIGGHGTACAGVTAAIADNALGVAGIAGGCSIMPLKVANTAGSLYLSYAANAIYYATDNGADVISMSFGAGITSDPATDAAVAYAYSHGVTLLGATGNANASGIDYPANLPQVIGVGAASPCGDRKRSSSSSSEVNPDVNTDPNGYTCDGERWWGSNYGSTVQDHQGAVDVLAPTILPTTDIQGSGGYASGDYSEFFNGTSCATPYAAGVCALIKSANPSFSPNQIRAQLVGTAQDIENVESVTGWDRYSGYGMVDAAAAVGAVIPPPVVAAFAADDSLGCDPLTVNFTDLSTGTIQSRLWDFGDGAQSLNENPSHTYDDPGVYDVSLYVTGPEGDDTLVKFDYITVGTVPAVSFTGSIVYPTYIVAGDSIDFTDTSTGNPFAWSWDFGDGGSSTLRNPSHVYLSPGLFSVTLTATNDCGPGSLTQTNMIFVIPPPAPTAAFSLTPDSGCAPLEVSFTDGSTGDPVTWLWDFGDGATDTVSDPVHIYTVPGIYDVTLTVGNAGGEDSATATSAVNVTGAPVAAFTVSDTLLAVGDSAIFSDVSTGSPTSWFWSFGDGDTSTEQHPVHQFDSPGVFTVDLMVHNSCGTDTLRLVDLITVEALDVPVAAFSHTPTAGCAPLEVTFTDESLNDVSFWNWSFGDGAQDTMPNPVHVYDTPGSFDVRLIVSGAGGVDSLLVTGAVVVEAPVAAVFALSDTAGLAPLAVSFTDQSAGNPTWWSWDFGDATGDTVVNPVHTYQDEGQYDVTLIVGNSCSADTLIMVAAVTVNGVSAVGDVGPARFGLAGNYPNPFNPSTTIVFHLAQPGHARLEVFDISGRRVATLVDATKTAGRHEVEWRPQDLASGVYFSRLVSDNQVDTKRVTLLK